MLISYAGYFVAYLLDKLEQTGKIENIERIVLYGSVAKGEAGKESDIDIFIEVKKKNIKFEKEVQRIEQNFYQSREAALFKTKGIDNRFSIKIGILKEWKELYRSIASTGIVLYGKYEAKELPTGVKHFVIVFWDKIGKNRGAFLNKLYGFKIRGRRYEGLLEKFEGRKLGKSCVMLPVQHKGELFRLIKKHKAQAHVLEVFT